VNQVKQISTVLPSHIKQINI